MVEMSEPMEPLGQIVSFARAQHARYGAAPLPETAPELPSGKATSIATCAVRDLLMAWRLDAERAGTAGWNPLGEFIRPGQRVVLKPNWVLHNNEAGFGFDCLCTHSSVIEAVLEYVALARPGSVVIGDAPIQKCVFGELLNTAGMEPIIDKFRARGLNLEIQDFRRTILRGDRSGAARDENARELDRYVLFDLKHESLLEPIARDYKKFRVSMYNPDRLRRTHAPGRHQYLVAREVIDADVVVNLPKLKCHCKAGITGALKNLVGINGNKEYLPHHRLGGQRSGGDCYEGRSILKECAEALADSAAKLEPGTLQSVVSRSSEVVLSAAARLGKTDRNLDGAWHGNDTVWRMSLDLQRLLHYGCADGSLSQRPVRQVITITDAIIGGQGEGPLRPKPVSSGFLTGGVNAAAVEWVNALLMGFDPERIPITAHSFADFSYPLARFRPAEIEIRAVDGIRPLNKAVELRTVRFNPSEGWAGHCELETDNDISGKPTMVA